ncbi:hypothetical protein PV726_10410 [Streptomyces europaeiscabiei]|uniref:hypothetical protein n=1 Tax=Streptomyces europaeiscabiei TaxID=146819 RepID=UPI0029B148CB|nr:hypothetical protein [Streptomyces europaeiscabiei]MDX3690726.1 hypothetical protein [Streptomyces europaeiscabiei]
MTLRPVDELYGRVADIHAAYGLADPAQRQAVEEAYTAFREHSGPFMVSVSAEMLDDLRADVRQNPDRVIAFLGRDGHSLAAAVRGLDPAFFDRHCREVVVSRAVVDAALQDLEKNAGASFPEAEAFRGARKKVDPADVDGSYRHLTDYLRASGVPMGLPDSSWLAELLEPADGQDHRRRALASTPTARATTAGNEQRRAEALNRSPPGRVMAGLLGRVCDAMVTLNRARAERLGINRGRFPGTAE